MRLVDQCGQESWPSNVDSLIKTSGEVEVDTLPKANMLKLSKDADTRDLHLTFSMAFDKRITGYELYISWDSGE